MLTIIWHSRTGASRSLAEAAALGADGASRLIMADQVSPANLQAASGYLFVCPENLGTMSGAMKEMFDRCYYSLLGEIEGRPYATIIAAGSDTGGRVRRVAEPMIVVTGAQTPEAILANKVVSPLALQQAEEMGAALALGLEQGIF